MEKSNHTHSTYGKLKHIINCSARALSNVSLSVIRMWKKMATDKLQDTYRAKPVFGLRSGLRISLQNIVCCVQSLPSLKMLVKESIAAVFHASYFQIGLMII